LKDPPLAKTVCFRIASEQTNEEESATKSAVFKIRDFECGSFHPLDASAKIMSKVWKTASLQGAKSQLPSNQPQIQPSGVAIRLEESYNKVP
jgi:hypothetical protein